MCDLILAKMQLLGMNNKVVHSGGNHEEHSQSSFKICWTDINAKCSKFVGFYSQIERLRQSGHTKQNNVIIKLLI